jgi:hypothetical protein
VGGLLARPESFNLYVYCENNPLAYTDSSGLLIDTLFDLGCFGGDVYQSIKGGRKNLGENLLYTGLDLGCLLIPGVTGGGDIVRGFQGFDRYFDNYEDLIRAIENGEDLGRAASRALRPTTRFVHNTTVASRGRVIHRGVADLGPTVDAIRSGSLKSRGVYKNYDGLLPSRAAGYYQEFEVMTAGMQSTGPERIILGLHGELYYTPDHYQTFIPIN